jgi:hypothetical protein
VVGTTYSADFPVTANAFQSQTNGAAVSTTFVTKLNAAGTAPLYSTYLGGSGGDFGYGIGIDPQGDAYITGATYSRDFPVTCVALLATNPSKTPGAPTSFVTKLNPDGILTYSTYLGGSGNQASPAEGDVAQAIAVDSSGEAYVTGYTWSSDFPVSDTAFQSRFAGSATVSNAFVTRLNAAGTGLVYSTYLGGSGSSTTGDYGNGIVLDSAGDAFVAGTTSSSNFPVTTGSYQMTLHGSSNAFLTELNPDGSDQVYSTYLGGSGGDSGQAIALDSSGFAYVAGVANSTDFPLTDGVVEGSNVGIGQYFGSDGSGAFVTKLSKDGTTLEYSTYFEGQGTSVTGLAVDGAGNAYLAGSAPTIGAGGYGGFQSTPDALTTPGSSGNSAFLVKLDPLAASLQYATLLGGHSNDAGAALAIDAAGNVYLTGSARSTDFPTTSGAFQKTNHGAADGTSNAFISKFSLASEANQTAYPGLPSNLQSTLVFTGGVGESCDGGDTSGQVQFVVTADLTFNAPGPPPTGAVFFEDNVNDQEFGVSGGWDPSSLSFPGVGESWVCGSCEDEFDNWGISYTGDSVYAPQTISGQLNGYACQLSDDNPARKHTPAAQLNSSAALRRASSGLTLHVTRTGAFSAKRAVAGPKFTPPPAVSPGNGRPSSDAIVAENQEGPACIAPKLPYLKVTLNSVSRLYGAANPELTYTVTGLIQGDSITVTPSATATASSPAGAYPVTATVSGASVSKYNVFIDSGTLTVLPAPLAVIVSPAAASRLYGAANNQNFTYAVSGLLNGDTVTVTLSTTATAASPVGAYPVTATVSGAAASNYALAVKQATLTVKPAPLSILATETSTYGQTPPPPSSYTLQGFVNTTP